MTTQRLTSEELERFVAESKFELDDGGMMFMSGRFAYQLAADTLAYRTALEQIVQCGSSCLWGQIARAALEPTAVEVGDGPKHKVSNTR
jgi:hypothetical protein